MTSIGDEIFLRSSTGGGGQFTVQTGLRLRRELVSQLTKLTSCTAINDRQPVGRAGGCRFHFLDQTVRSVGRSVDNPNTERTSKDVYSAQRSLQIFVGAVQRAFRRVSSKARTLLCAGKEEVERQYISHNSEQAYTNVLSYTACYTTNYRDRQTDQTDR